jgi:hypothetical protein
LMRKLLTLGELLAIDPKVLYGVLV